LAVALVVLTATFITSAVSCESISPGRPQPTTGPDAGAPVMRVRLGETRHEAEFASDGSLEFAAAGATGGAMRTKPGDSVKVTFDGQGWLAALSTGESRRLGGGALHIRQLSPEPIQFMNGLHEGQFTLIPRADVSSGGFDLIERVAIETYIAGVISKELYASWTPAAFESQAIAARSYALHERERQMIAKRDWDIESTDSDQVYAGAAANPTALRAAQTTRGKVLHYNGHLLRAYYSSTCGGRAASARDIWPTGPGFEFNLAWPIQAHERPCGCEASPLYRWEVRRTKDDVLLRLVGFGKANGYAIRSMTSLKDIKVDRTNTLGRPTRYKIFDEQGKSWTLSAEDLRRATNFSGAGLTPITRDIRVHSSDFEVKPTGDSFDFNGRGFGHGVGLCQFGAEGFGKQSKSAEQILGIMYPGAVITSAY
jgi:stage II sporulation protein D